MKTDAEKFFILEGIIKRRVPDFKIKYKDEDKLMLTLSKILFFNKRFFTDFTTTIGKTVYFPSREKVRKNTGNYFSTLCHEYVHVLDYVQNPFLFVIKYLFPQLLIILALLAFFAFINPLYLLFLIALAFAAPIPAPGRTWAELRGYGMSLKVKQWKGKKNIKADDYIEQFTSANYYFMCPFSNYVKKKLQMYLDSDECLKDKNPAYMEVYNLVVHENI